MTRLMTSASSLFLVPGAVVRSGIFGGLATPVEGISDVVLIALAALLGLSSGYCPTVLGYF